MARAGLVKIYQIRVKPEPSFFRKRWPVYFDSATVFSTPKAAQSATGSYIRDLVEAGLLNPKKKYSVEVILLNLVNLPMEGNEDLKKSKDI